MDFDLKTINIFLERMDVTKINWKSVLRSTSFIIQTSQILENPSKDGLNTLMNKKRRRTRKLVVSCEVFYTLCGKDAVQCLQQKMMSDYL